MRVPLLCADCIRAERLPAECTVYATANDTGIYEICCRAGHKSIVVLAATRHEQLFELGLSAITDQYFREAVSSFSAALERFYEFSTAVLAQSAGVKSDAFDLAWKHVARQSERQLGAFVAAHLFVEGLSPAILPPKAVEFRNEVVHKGKFPSQAEALQFGDEVLSVIRPTLSAMKARHPVALEAQWLKPHRKALESPQLVGKPLTSHYPSMTLRNFELEAASGKDTRHYVWLFGVRHGHSQ